MFCYLLMILTFKQCKNTLIIEILMVVRLLVEPIAMFDDDL